jgi:hypothetical protein
MNGAVYMYLYLLLCNQSIIKPREPRKSAYSSVVTSPLIDRHDCQLSQVKSDVMLQSAW